MHTHTARQTEGDVHLTHAYTHTRHTSLDSHNTHLYAVHEARRTKRMGPSSAAEPSKQDKVGSRGRHGNRSKGYRDETPVLYNPKSVLKRKVSPEELQTPGGKYIKRTFTIVGDAVGWGFVVRGSSPCHIQAVDPSGPAAAVGMKVCQFVVSVNGLNVLETDYRTVSHLILTGPRTIVMEIMEPLDS